MQDTNSDADFDAYWEDEARNPNRNRIRIGRQYQATIPPLIKPGESDGRNLEDLETLKWRPENHLPDLELDHYLSVVKAIFLLTRLLENEASERSTSDNTSGETLTETPEDDQVESNEGTSHNECKDDKNGEKFEENSEDVEKQIEPNWEDSTEYLKTALKGLSDFILTHKGVFFKSDNKVPIKSSEQKESSNQQILSLPKGKWSPTEIHLFTIALEFCGKNFSAIKKEFLPWKSVKSIIEFYYLGLGKEATSTAPKETLKNSKQCNIENQNTDNDSSSCEGNPSRTNTSSPSSKENDYHDCASPSGNHCSVVSGISSNHKKCESNDECEKGCPLLNGLEVKAIKGRPVSPKLRSEAGHNISNLGSLKFYKDGHLVLKLNAKQEEAAQKTHWVESQDTPRLNKPIPNLKGNGSKSDTNNHKSNHLADDGDDNSVDSSDVESQASSENNFQAVTNVNNPKIAKVRAEDCFMPLSSCSSITKGSTISAATNSSLTTSTTVTHHDTNNSTFFSTKRPMADASIAKSSLKSIEINDLKKRSKTVPSSTLWPSEHKNMATVSAPSSVTSTGLDSKWYMNVDEKSSQLPPVAHAASSRYALGNKSSSTSCISNFHAPSSSITTKPVDLTRKTCPNSPSSAKSSSSSSS